MGSKRGRETEKTEQQTHLNLLQHTCVNALKARPQVTHETLRHNQSKNQAISCGIWSWMWVSDEEDESADDEGFVSLTRG